MGSTGKIILQTPRLLLREFTLADAALVFKLNSDPEVLKYLHEPALKDIAEAEKILTEKIFPQYENGLGRWAAFRRSDNQFIGWCGLKFRPELNETDLGYRFLKSYWGKGYATDAARHTLQYAFKNLKLDAVIGRAHVENIASQMVLEKTGMKHIKDEIIDHCPVKTYLARITEHISQLPKV